MRIQNLFHGGCVCALMLLLAQNLHAISIAIAGDSMAAPYSETLPLRGWGMELPFDFTANVSFLNEARSGSSTKSFLWGSASVDGVPNIHHWDNIIRTRPDYVLISFGANDMGSSNPEIRTTVNEYKANLSKMVDDLAAIGAKPLFITSPPSRYFRADGTIVNDIRPEALAMMEVGASKSVPVYDLNSSLASLYESLGPTDSRKFGYSDTDILHFGEYGAEQVSSLISLSLIQYYPELSQDLVSVPEPTTFFLVGVGTIGLLAWVWRWNRKINGAF